MLSKKKRQKSDWIKDGKQVEGKQNEAADYEEKGFRKGDKRREIKRQKDGKR